MRLHELGALLDDAMLGLQMLHLSLGGLQLRRQALVLRLQIEDRLLQLGGLRAEQRGLSLKIGDGLGLVAGHLLLDCAAFLGELGRLFGAGRRDRFLLGGFSGGRQLVPEVAGLLRFLCFEDGERLLHLAVVGLERLVLVGRLRALDGGGADERRDLLRLAEQHAQAVALLDQQRHVLLLPLQQLLQPADLLRAAAERLLHLGALLVVLRLAERAQRAPQRPVLLLQLLDGREAHEVLRNHGVRVDHLPRGRRGGGRRGGVLRGGAGAVLQLVDARQRGLELGGEVVAVALEQPVLALEVLVLLAELRDG